MFASNDEEDERAAMTLTNEEARWTSAVKEAVLEDESLKKLSDYEYAQHALFTDGNVARSLYQIEGMQQFKEEYKITDTVEEGMTLLRQFQEQLPWFLLDVGYEQNHFVVVMDYKQYKPALLRLPEDWRTFLGAFYYIFQMVTSNIQSIREGVIFVGEVEGMGWENVSVDAMRIFWEHFLSFLPLKFKEVSWMHNSVIGNIFESLHRSIMKEHCWGIQIGVRNEAYDGRLDAMFKVPTPDVALERLMDKCKILLTKSFQHHELYHLPTTSPLLTEEDVLFREAMQERVARVREDGGGEEGSDEEVVEDA